MAKERLELDAVRERGKQKERELEHSKKERL